MPAIAPIAGIAGSVIGGITGNSAANAQAEASRQAAAIHMEQSAQADRVAALNRQDQFPWMATGTNAINTLSHLMGIAGGATNRPWAPTYAGANPNAASPFMVGSPAGARGTAAGLSPASNPASGTNALAAFANRQSNVTPQPGIPPDGIAGIGANPAATVGFAGQGSPLNPANAASTSGMTAGNSGGLMNDNGPGQGVADPNQPGGPQFQGPPAGGFTDMGAAGNAMGVAPGGGAGVPAPSAPQDASGGFDTSGLGGDGSLAQSWTQAFQAPDNLTEQNDPGFQARLKMGTDAMQNSAAARGNLLTGGTAKDLSNYGQNYASNEYGNVYNRALGQYQQNYNIFQNNQANLFNRLSALAGGGQVAAQNISGGALQAYGQAADQAGQAANANQGAAYQRASGYVNTGNAITSGLGNAASLAAILKGSNSTPNYPQSPDLA